MSNNVVSSKITSKDEILLLKHMANKLREGFLGDNESIVLGEDPVRRYFSGVLFSSEQFNHDVNVEDDEDPDIQYKSLAKNYNMGLEFLVTPENKKIKGTISGSFNLYFRLFPTYQEQMNSLDYLVNNEIQNQEEIVSSIPTQQKGITLYEKYQKNPIDFEDIPFEIDTVLMEPITIPLDNYIKESINPFIHDQDFFNVNPNVIHKTGYVEMSRIPSNEGEYMKFLESIKSDELHIPEWKAYLLIDPIYYKDKNGKEYIKLVVTLVNNTPLFQNEKPTGHPSQMFSCGFDVKIIQGIHFPFIFDGATNDYKYDKSYPVKGINCVGNFQDKGSVRLNTEVIPVFFQQLYRTREDLSVEFDDLTSPEKVIQTLNYVLVKMKEYLISWQMFIDNHGDDEQPLKNEDDIKSCVKDKLEFEKEIDTFELGIYSLRKSSNLMSAFIIMNKVFKESGKGKYTSWRLFQIIFIVRILPSFHNRELDHKDIRKAEIVESAQIADVLWFPTGGGKTEAYFGLLITALFFDRLRGKKLGCSAWIRFPLRMLSKNQLDRLAKIIIVAEKFREEFFDIEDKGKPFSIGFFAGSGNTYNFVGEKKIKQVFKNDHTKKNKMLIHKCPSCNKDLELSFDSELWRFKHVCKNPDCFVFNSKTLKGILPIYITDSEVYRFLPSVICGTVDKLAILGRYREFSQIFGQIGGRCPKHGFFSDRCIVGAWDEYDSCKERAKNTAAYKNTLDMSRRKIYDPIPMLLIQDELHLLKEELGALDGHYEGVLLEYSKNFGREENHTPKIIAATATIESYEHHITHLYMRKPRRYPSMGYKRGESFYATSTPSIDRRLYMGVLPHTKSQEEVMGRAIYIYQKEINRLHENPALTLAEFDFESVNTIDEYKKLLSFYDLSTIYVNTKNTGTDVRRRIEEINSFPQKLTAEILTGENDMDKIIQVIDRIESEGGNGDYKDKLQVLIATSLISHGVDLERINNFFMAGMPSKQAEYIQASSRSARSHAGLVFVSFRPTDLRERSQYQFFVQNHVFMDYLVDPVPINRLALKAIERTLPGVLSGLLLGIHSQLNNNDTIYSCGSFKEYKSQMLSKGIDLSNIILEQLNRIYGVYNDSFPLSARKKVERFIEQLYYEKEHMLDISSSTLKIKSEDALNPITSFRDIEEGLPIQASVETSIILNYANRSKEIIGGD